MIRQGSGCGTQGGTEFWKWFLVIGYQQGRDRYDLGLQNVITIAFEG